MKFHPLGPLGHDGRHFGGGSPPPLPAATPAPTADDPATKAKTDAAAAAARALAMRRQGAAANIFTPRPTVGPRAVSLLGGGETR